MLGEHTLFTVNLRGQLVSQRRLEYHPAACWPYTPSAAGGGGRDRASGFGELSTCEHLLVATHNR